MTSKEDRVYDWLRDQISEGVYQSGDPLSATFVRGLVNSNGNGAMTVSRATVYAALKRLQRDGFLVSAGERGTFTVGIFPELTAAQVAGLKAYLSAYCIWTSGAELNDRLAPKLERMTRAMRLSLVRFATDTGDGAAPELVEAFLAYDLAFHRALVRAADHGALAATYHFLDRMGMDDPPHDYATIDRHLDAHETFLEALKQGDVRAPFLFSTAHRDALESKENAG